MNSLTRSKMFGLAACFLAVVFVCAGCASKPAAAVQIGDVSLSTYGATVERNGPCPSPVNGVVSQIGNEGLPAPFDANTVIVATTLDYWFEGEKASVPVECIIGGINVDKNLTAGTVVDDSVSLGTAVSSFLTFNLRSSSPDVYLALCAYYGDDYIQLVGDWYYFGMGAYDCLSELDFQPLASADDGYEFYDFPESLREIYEQGYQRYLEGKGSVDNYPRMGFCILAAIDEYPSRDMQFKSDISVMQRLMIQREFEDFQSVAIEWDGVPLQIFCVEECVNDLREYYTLGEPVWLYLQADKVINGELCCYLWDYSDDSPSEYARMAQVYMLNEYLDIQ